MLFMQKHRRALTKNRNTMKTRLNIKGFRAILRVAYETPVGEYLVIDIVDEFLIILS